MVFPSARPCEKYSAVAAIQAESIFVTAEPDACIGCGTCVDSCRHPALQKVSRIVVIGFHRKEGVRQIPDKGFPSEQLVRLLRQMGRRE